MIKNDRDKGHVTATIIHTSNWKRLKVGVEPDNYNGEGRKWSKSGQLENVGQKHNLLNELTEEVK